MPTIRYLRLRFANHLRAEELPYFRAAVIEASRRQSDLFHNHRDDNGVLYRYPLIQYRLLGGRAAIVCLEAGVDDIHYLLEQRQLDLQIGRRRATFTIDDVVLRQHRLQCWERPFHYRLRHWQALNPDNFRRWQALDSEVERLQFLESLLRSNMLALASGLDWQVDQPITAGITRLHGARRQSFKNQPVLTFDLDFKTNVSLPDGIGLGKGVSVGFGGIWTADGRRRTVDGGRATLPETETPVEAEENKEA